MLFLRMFMDWRLYASLGIIFGLTILIGVLIPKFFLYLEKIKERRKKGVKSLKIIDKNNQ